LQGIAPEHDAHLLVVLIDDADFAGANPVIHP
jgi:hypothetical protein